jgi:hypothetical protein
MMVLCIVNEAKHGLDLSCAEAYVWRDYGAQLLKWEILNRPHVDKYNGGPVYCQWS